MRAWRRPASKRRLLQAAVIEARAVSENFKVDVRSCSRELTMPRSASCLWLIGVSTTSLILEEWDDELHRPAGDPFVLDLGTISKLEVP